jgi:single-stranded DNA-binding protein
MSVAADKIECAFIGCLGTDAEMRTSKAGKPYARFSVMVGEGDDAQWARVTYVGGKLADTAPHLLKGARAYVEGTLKLSTWQDRQGHQRHGLEILAQEVTRALMRCVARGG